MKEKATDIDLVENLQVMIIFFFIAVREWRKTRQNRGFTDAFFWHFEPERDTAENS